MVVTFDLQAYEGKEVTPEEICEEVEMIGFDCELTLISEIQQQKTQKRKTGEVKKQRRSEFDQQNGQESDFSEAKSFDSNKLAGNDEDTTRQSNVSIKKAQIALDPQKSLQMKGVSQTEELKQKIEKLQGVVQVSQEMNEKQIAILNVVFKSNGVPLRQIV